MDLTKTMILYGLNNRDKIKESAVDAETYERGYAYAIQGHVKEIKQIGDTLLAKTEGSGFNEYQQVIVFNADSKSYYATCTCPDQREGNCKHLIAVLLKCVTNKSFVDIVAKITDIRKTMVNELYQELPITAKIVDKYKDAIIGADLLRISWALHFLTLDEFDNWVSRLSSRKDALPQSAKKG